MADAQNILRNSAPFADFDDDAISRLSEASELRSFAAGERIVSRGTHSTAVGIVVVGELALELKTELQHLEVERPTVGAVFGEFGLLTGDPPVADIHAKVDSQVLMVPHTAILQEIAKNPLATRGFATLMASRYASRRDNADFQDLAQHARRVRDESGTTLPVLVVNLGSSSLKYALFQHQKSLLCGLVERIGSNEAQITQCRDDQKETKQLRRITHEQALDQMFAWLIHPELGALDRIEDIGAVGHRVVHGGNRFTHSVPINDEVLDELKRCALLAPLHNPINVLGIEYCRKKVSPATPMVAVFDTAFHMTMPEQAYTYALPSKLAQSEQLRRYGFHGISHKYVSQAATQFLEKPPGTLKIVSCHLGNGSSVAAINHGRSVDTSMGMTPLEGLVMGTRSGDVDPGLLLHLMRLGYTEERLDELLNRQSGLLGISGLASDMRSVEKAADAGHEGAMLAIAAYCYRVRKYIGAYAAAMGGIDVLIFTGGIGENAINVRQRIASDMGFIGIHIDTERNRTPSADISVALDISTPESTVRVLIVPTDEEAMIARETLEALERTGLHDILSARKDRQIPIGISVRHVHLQADHIRPLFGRDELTPLRELSQKGNWACDEMVDLVGPRGTIERVRVLGPARENTQVEISRTDEFKLGIDAPIRASGDVANSPGLTLRGPAGSIDIEEGVICAYRHIHMDPEDALAFGLRDRDIVRVHIPGERSVIFGDVLVRVYPGFSLEMHLDTDEANAAEVHPGMTCTIESIQQRT
ncbi:MAG: acetate/propionate family kinase [Proteobacteria bacterium]|nr:acetate/propionate family kinase [Pseudomonadota bacterium]